MKDGGPAFPRTGFATTGRGEISEEFTAGMSLRDYMAAAALSGMLATETADEWYTKASNAAERAYELADAMLSAREAT